MERVRREAVGGGTATSARAVFLRRFAWDLNELVGLYRASFWKNSPYGGNKWAPICSTVRELVEALESGENARAEELCELIPRMEHNTGLVSDKLRKLKSACKRMS
jgi:hypothetical protein